MKTRNILCAFLTLIAVGCVKENEMPSGDKTPAGGNTITVNMPELTRTAIGDETQTGVSLVWSKGDEIAVIEGKGTETQKHSVYRLVGEGGTASGTFEYISGDASAEVITDVVFPASAVENNYAVPAAQTYVEGSFDTDAMVMSWTRASEDEGITLKHEAAVLMFTVTGTTEQNISSVEVECGENTYTLTCAEPVALSSEGTVFYVAVPGSETSQDYVVTFTAEGDETLTKDLTYALNAGKIGRLPAFAFETTPAVEPLKVGDYFGGGFVIKIDEEANIVKIVSKDEATLAWAVEAHKETLAGVTADNTDGDINTAILVQNGIENYPAAEWCVNHGEGWYMPSRIEITNIVNGLGLETDMEAVNARFVEYGGDPFVSKRYFTCTETSAGNCVWTNAIPGKGQNNDNTKTYARPVRAVKKIALTGGETADPKPESQIVNITPTMDAHFVAAIKTSGGKGSSGPTIRIIHNSNGDWKYASYFKFDIASIDADDFLSAVLNLTIDKTNTKFLDKNSLAVESLKINVTNVTDEWTEGDNIAWPTSLPNMQTTSHTVYATDSVICIDLTQLVKERLEKGDETFSFRITMDESMGSKAKIYVHSKESTVEGTQPYLQVTTLK